MGTKLTKAQRETLEACPDWSAPYEVAKRRRDANPLLMVYGASSQRMLVYLRSLGLVEFGAANNTFRITDAGREALREASHDH